tara:strand:+ start:31 stop:222 length:192 start_codon:yes stop_codon:yes gene_type:complete
MSDENKLVLVDVRKEYGIERAYPANEMARLFSYLTRSKTLSREQLQIISKLGFKVEAEISWRL